MVHPLVLYTYGYVVRRLVIIIIIIIIIIGRIEVIITLKTNKIQKTYFLKLSIVSSDC